VSASAADAGRPEVAVGKQHGRVYERGDSRRWGEILFGSALGKKCHADPTAMTTSWDARSIAAKDGALPLFEVGGDRFMSGVDLCVGANGDYEILKAFAWLDPSIGVELPTKATHAKVKFHNPMVKSAARNFGAEDVLKIELGNHTWAKRWRPDGADGAETIDAIAGAGNSPTQELAEDGLDDGDPEGASAKTAAAAKSAKTAKGAGRRDSVKSEDPGETASAAGEGADDNEEEAPIGDEHWRARRRRWRAKTRTTTKRRLPSATSTGASSATRTPATCRSCRAASALT